MEAWPTAIGNWRSLWRPSTARLLLEARLVYSACSYLVDMKSGHLPPNASVDENRTGGSDRSGDSRRYFGPKPPEKHCSQSICSTVFTLFQGYHASVFQIDLCPDAGAAKDRTESIGKYPLARYLQAAASHCLPQLFLGSTQLRHDLLCYEDVVMW